MKIELADTSRMSMANRSSDKMKEKKGNAAFPTKNPSTDTYQLSRASFFWGDNGLPKNFLLGMGGVKLPHGNERKMVEQIHSAYIQYYSGEADESVVRNAITDIVEQLRSNYVELGFDEARIMPDIIEDVYASARMNAVSCAGEVSNQEGKRLAGAFDQNTNDWIFYDSKYYYRCESMKTDLLKQAQELGEQYGTANLNLPKDYDSDDIRSMYSSYNSIINNSARNRAIVGNMLDDTIVPPENFRFLYKGEGNGMNVYPEDITEENGDPDSIFDGILQIWQGDWSFTGRVPVRFDATKYPASLNMFHIVSQKSTNGFPENITSFLKNIDFFTTLQSGRYFESHPRAY